MTATNLRKVNIYWMWFAAGLCALIYLLSTLAFPFVIGMVLSYCFKPLKNLISRNVAHNASASLITTILVLLLFIGIFYIIVPSLTNSIYTAIRYLPRRIGEYAQTGGFGGIFGDKVTSYLAEIRAGLLPSVSQGASLALHFVAQLISLNVNLIAVLLISPFVMFFTLRDWNSIAKSIRRLVPISQQENFSELTSMVDMALMSYLKSQLKISVIMIFYYTIALWGIGFKKAFIVGIFSGILSFLPYAGCVGGFALSIVIGLAQYGQSLALWPLILTYFTGYVIEIYILTPKFGKKVGLHTIWIFLALFLGIQLNGLFGLFISIPSAIVINITIKYLLHKFRQSEMYRL